MERDYYIDYALITGQTVFGDYISPEDEANSIEKCSILRRVNVTYGNNSISNETEQAISVLNS